MRGCLIVLLGLATAAPAEIWTGTAEITFEGTSTLHDFSGQAPVAPFPVSVVQEGNFATLGATVAVAVAQMDTRDAKRDENLRRMFAAERYPLVVGTVPPIQIDLASPPASIPIQIAIRDRTRTIPAALSNWQPADGRYRFELTLNLSLQDFGLKPPVLLGLIRVGDAVVVRARATLARRPENASP